MMPEEQLEALFRASEFLEYLKQRQPGLTLALELVGELEGDRAAQIHLLLEDYLGWLETYTDDISHNLKSLRRWANLTMPDNPPR